MNELCMKSMFDQDLYKATMLQAVLKKHAGTPVSYIFNNRSPKRKFNLKFLDALNDQIKGMTEVRTTETELSQFFQMCPFLDKPTLHPYFANYRFNSDQIEAKLSDGNLELKILESPWESSILWEVPLLYTISELYFKYCDNNWTFSEKQQIDLISKKAKILKGCNYSDFGTRRRRNYKTQDLVVKTLSSKGFHGTSNIHLAMKYNVRAIGTIAHEYYMAVSVLRGLRHANKFALEEWSDVFNGDLGIALTDTYGTKTFFEDFDGHLARLFDGLRQDSGDAIIFGENAVAFYEKMGIDPLTKILVFSDGLDPDAAVKIAQHFKNRIRTSFGLGTNFTNDYLNSPALNIVIKMNTCNGIPVVKLSDTPSKAIGDKDALRVARWTFNQTPLDQEL